MMTNKISSVKRGNLNLSLLIVALTSLIARTTSFTFQPQKYQQQQPSSVVRIPPAQSSSSSCIVVKRLTHCSHGVNTNSGSRSALFSENSQNSEASLTQDKDNDESEKSNSDISASNNGEDEEEEEEEEEEEWEYEEFENLEESDFYNSEWKIGTLMDESNNLDETWCRLVVDEDSQFTCVWGDGAKGKWNFDPASQFLSMSKDTFGGWFGKKIWAGTIEDFYFMQGTVRGWSPISPASVVGQWQAKRLGVDKDEAGIAPWFEDDETESPNDETKSETESDSEAES